MHPERRATRSEIYSRLARIERPAIVLEGLLGQMAHAAGSSTEKVVADEASSIYADSLGVGFTRLELAHIRCRCDVARLTVIKARPGSLITGALVEARRTLEQVERHIKQADAELFAWIVARLRSRGDKRSPVRAPDGPSEG